MRCAGISALDHGGRDLSLVGAQRDHVVEHLGEVVRNHVREELRSSTTVIAVVEQSDDRGARRELWAQRVEGAR